MSHILKKSAVQNYRPLYQQVSISEIIQKPINLILLLFLGKVLKFRSKSIAVPLSLPSHQPSTAPKFTLRIAALIKTKI